MPSFVIAALPRSRTAWLANFLTTDGAVCEHDLSVRVGSMAEFRQRLSDTDAGVADTGLSIGPDFVPAPGDGPLVLIQRPVAEVIAACRVAFPRQPATWIDRAVRAGQTGLDRLRPHAMLVLDYAGLVAPDAIEAIWRVCRPGQPFPHARYAQQAAFHLTIHPAAYEAQVTQAGADWLVRRMQAT